MPNKIRLKSPEKSVSGLMSGRLSYPGIKPRALRPIKTKSLKEIASILRKEKSSLENKENKVDKKLTTLPKRKTWVKRTTNLAKKESKVNKKSVKIASPAPPKKIAPKVAPRKPVEGIDFAFEIPQNLTLKKREVKAADKAKEFADITNQNSESMSNATPMR